MPNVAVSVDHTRERKAREARERRERNLRALMAAEEKESEKNPFVKVVNNQRPPDQVTASAGRLISQKTPMNANGISVSGIANSRLSTTNLTSKPWPQTEQLQGERQGKSSTKMPPASVNEHAKAAKPIAAPATSQVSRIDRPCNSDRRLQNALERVSKLEADRAQLRREREIDRLLRASKTQTKLNQSNESSQGRQLHEQDPGRRSHSAKSATSRPETNSSAIGAAWPELRVELPLRKTQKVNENAKDVITVATNRPRPATTETISSTSSEDTTPSEGSTAFVTPQPPQSMQSVLEATCTYFPLPGRQKWEKSNASGRNACEIAETPPPSPREAQQRTPSSTDDDSSVVSPRKLPQRRHVSLGNSSNDSRTTFRDVAENSARESSIPGMEALNIRDKSPLTYTNSGESVRKRSPIPAGDADSDYQPSSPILMAGEESEAPTIAAFGPDSGPATPVSSRHTSNLFSPSEPSISHMSMLSSPGMPSATSPTESDGNNTPTSRSRPGESHRVLDRYLGAIFDQETRSGADFLAKHGEVYQRVIRTFFDIKCDCTHSHEHDDPEQSHSLRERVAYLQRSLPPLSEVFGENESYDPRSYFHLWQKILSDQQESNDALSISDAHIQILRH